MPRRYPLFRRILALGFFAAMLPAVPSALAYQAATLPQAGAKAGKLVNLNTASVAELEGLPGISPATARAIVAARPFKTVKDLGNVKGLGEAKVAQLRDLVSVSSPAPTTPVAKKAAAKLVNLNTASVAELEGLPGIGPATARAIVAARPFKTVNDLGNVKGLGEAKVAQLRDLVVVAAPVAGPAAKSSPRTGSEVMKPSTDVPAKAKAKSAAALPIGKKLNLNSATREDLELLPLIGPVKAQAILDARPFKTIEALKEVKGIGDVTFERIKDLVTID